MELLLTWRSAVFLLVLLSGCTEEVIKHSMLESMPLIETGKVVAIDTVEVNGQPMKEVTIKRRKRSYW